MYSSATLSDLMAFVMLGERDLWVSFRKFLNSSFSLCTTLQVIKNYVFLQPIVHKPLG